ncbi:MAG: hypothetical protein H0T76_24410 [Nannocystis sp.]|nr:hypothetical protein [Nannocystis sp.]MBA3549633.1 hypothetical protein [Nannocystis sp.]
MTHLLILCLLMLPPDAALHHDRAVAHHEAGRLEAAIDEFAAAYAALPDPRDHGDDREQMLGSLNGLLLRQHETTGAVQPLCRLGELLWHHVDALQAAYPDEPGRRELMVNRERLAVVGGKLAALPDGTCMPVATATPVVEPPVVEPPVVETPVAETVIAAPVADATPARPLDADAKPGPRRGLRIGGGVALGVGAGLLGLMTYGLVEQRRRRDDARALEIQIGATISRSEYETLRDARSQAHNARLFAIGTGLGAAASLAIGTTLLVLDRRARRGRARPIALAPWWLSSGAGLTVALRLP